MKPGKSKKNRGKKYTHIEELRDKEGGLAP